MYEKGKMVLIPFPFTDLSATKVRPVVVLSNSMQGDDIVVAFISSKKQNKIYKTDVVVKTANKDFIRTGLKTDSIIKVGKLATLDKKIVLGE
jgi:mRNA interferase MazF